jgi:hypothetical protein
MAASRDAYMVSRQRDGAAVSPRTSWTKAEDALDLAERETIGCADASVRAIRKRVYASKPLELIMQRNATARYIDRIDACDETISLALCAATRMVTRL